MKEKLQSLKEMIIIRSKTFSLSDRIKNAKNIYNTKLEIYEKDRKEGEQGGVKNYKNGSIHVIYEGRTTKNDLKESLEKRLLSALDKSYKYMDSRNMPIIMDVIFNVRETK